MQIYLVRHGATDWNVAGRCQGATDLELNEVGLKQAEQAATYLGRERIDAVYSSNLKRAVQTASAVGQIHKLDVVIEESLRELDHGELEGLTFAEIRANHPNFIRQWRERPADAAIPGGERLLDVERRAWEGMRRIAQRHGPYETLIVVSHNFPILAVLCRVTGTPLNRYRLFHLDPGGVVRLRHDGGDEWRVISDNGGLPFRGI